jgi:hypothetical protein
VRHLRRAFSHIAGLHRRQQLNSQLDAATDRLLKLQEYVKIGDSLDPQVRLHSVKMEAVERGRC